MDTQRNNISSQAILSALAGMMFFAPFVKKNVELDPKYTQEEKSFIMGYVQVWFANLVFFVLTLIAAIVNLFLIHPILTWVVNIWSFAIFIITVFSMFACINALSMRKSDESIMQNIQNKGQLARAYVPILNFLHWFHQESYSMPYWWLKESVLLRTCFILGTMLLWCSFWIWILIIIAIRFILLLLNIDIIPLSMKKTLNSAFSCNPTEIMAYISTPIISKLKKTDYETTLQQEKTKYMLWEKFGVSIILQYILFIWLLLLIYRWMDFYLTQIVLAVAIILWIARVWLFYRYKKMFLRIPVLSELLSLIFH